MSSPRRVAGRDLLYALKVNDPPSREGGHDDFIRVRDLAPGESESIRERTKLLNALTVDSNYAALARANQTYFATIGIAESQIGGRVTQESILSISTAFKNWLSAFRSFDDRTAAWLSRLYGKKHPLSVVFKNLTSQEYDLNFAYRLAWALRNVSEHVGNVLNDLSSYATDRESGGQIQAAIDGPRLAADHTKLKPPIREALRHGPPRLNTKLIANLATMSCERVHCGLILAMRAHIEEAIAVLESLDQEALDAGGDQAMIILSVDVEALAGGHIATRYNDLPAASLARQNLHEASTVMSQPSFRVEAEDLALGV